MWKPKFDPQNPFKKRDSNTHLKFWQWQVGEQTHSNPWPDCWPVRLIFLLGQVLDQWETLCEKGQGGGKWLRNDTQGGLLIPQSSYVHPHPHTWTIVHTHHTAICIKPWHLNRFVTILHYTENYNDKEIPLFLRGHLWICLWRWPCSLLFSTSLSTTQTPHKRDIQIFEARITSPHPLLTPRRNIRTISFVCTHIYMCVSHLSVCAHVSVFLKVRGQCWV